MYTNTFSIFREYKVLSEAFLRPLIKGCYSTSPKSISYLRQRRRNIPLLGWLLLRLPPIDSGTNFTRFLKRTLLVLGFTSALLVCGMYASVASLHLDDIKNLEYKPVRIRGTFLHDKELFMGPRTLLSSGDASSKSSLMTKANTSGYLVITPFKLENRDEIILINRGWVSSEERNPNLRLKGQIEGPTNVIGLVRLHEPRPTFSMKNQEGSNLFFHRDLQQMAERTGALPIFLDATQDFDLPGGPVGGQTRITLRNEHMSYILTWFTLGGATSYMWYAKFIR